MRMPKTQAAAQLTEAQKAQLETLVQLYDATVAIAAQSEEYRVLAKEFNATLCQEQRGYARAL